MKNSPIAIVGKDGKLHRPDEIKTEDILVSPQIPKITFNEVGRFLREEALRD